VAATAAPGPAELAAFARQVYPGLDQYSYYQLLRVAPAADARAIRASYYRIAAQLHPDRYHNLADGAMRDQLETIYARISEAYRVLINQDKRIAYDRALAQGKMRYDAGERQPQGPKNPEDTLTSAQGKKFFRLGMICLGKKDWKGAVMNFNFARTFEPGAPAIAEKLAEAQAAAGAGAGAGAGKGTPGGSPR
jgi:curved DNA-binding protein CbpA